MPVMIWKWSLMISLASQTLTTVHVWVWANQYWKSFCLQFDQTSLSPSLVGKGKGSGLRDLGKNKKSFYSNLMVLSGFGGLINIVIDALLSCFFSRLIIIDYITLFVVVMVIVIRVF